MTSRDEQKEQRRKQILFIALELFAKKGYSDTKIGDIAKAAGMSTGLMFHYFESKEQLYEELVRMGTQGANDTPAGMYTGGPLDYFEGFVNSLFTYAKQQPWVLHMFVLMGQARRSDAIPGRIREIAMSVSQIEQSVAIIEQGQKAGVIREGDPYALSLAFWASVTGVMEQLAASPELLSGGKTPEASWLVDILRAKN